MFRNFVYGTFVVRTLTATTSNAQVGTGASARPPLTLRAATEEALARNPELVALQGEYEAARAAPEGER